MKISDLQAYCDRFSPDDTIEFICCDCDGDKMTTTDAELLYLSTPTISLIP